MSRYIDADALEKAVYRSCIDNQADILTLIEDQPTADVEEVVMCKDCLYGVKRTDLGGRYMCRRVYHYNSPEFYCSHGERREG